MTRSHRDKAIAIKPPLDAGGDSGENNKKKQTKKNQRAKNEADDARNDSAESGAPTEPFPPIFGADGSAFLTNSSFRFPPTQHGRFPAFRAPRRRDENDFLFLSPLIRSQFDCILISHTKPHTFPARLGSLSET